MEFEQVSAAAAYRRIDQTSRVEGASPHGLIGILLEEVLAQIDAMGAGLSRGQRHHEAQARAVTLLLALEASLDHQSGGTTAGLMAQVYRETRRCLSRAAEEVDPFWCKQARQTVEPIAQAWGQIGATLAQAA